MTLIYKYAKDESGAVTVDWVVLTAAIVAIALAVIAYISTGIQSASNGINDGYGRAGSIGRSMLAGNDPAETPGTFLNTGYTDPDTGQLVYYNPETDQVRIGEDGDPTEPSDYNPGDYIPPDGDTVSEIELPAEA